MVDISANTVLGLALEVTPGTFVAPSAPDDLLTVADLRPSIAGLTSEVSEFTGSIHRPGPKVGGASFEVSGRCLLRGPGGTEPPAADTFVAGRILRAAGFAETILSAAIPVAPEALGSATDGDTVVLGTTAAGTADLYTGLAVHLAALGALNPNAGGGITLIKDYLADKTAELAETFGGSLAGNYQILEQVAYILSSAAAPTLSASTWIGSKRYDGRGLSLSSLRINLPTFSRESTDLPSIEFTLTGDLHQDADDTAPVPDVSLAVPSFKNGKLMVANTKLGGSSLSIDFGATVAYAPDPNQTTGNLAATLTETTRRAELTLNHVSKASFDFLGLANAQSYHSIMALYGLASGNAVGALVPEARFNYFSPDNGGALVNMTGEMLIDGADRSIALVFPYY